MSAILEAVRQRAVELWTKEGLLSRTMKMNAGPLTVEQAIGTPDGKDFPLQQGKELLMEAGFDGNAMQGARGQAFTDQPGPYTGTLGQIAALPLDSNFHMAVFVAALNAVMRGLGRTSHTVHCRDHGPRDCAAMLPGFVRAEFGTPRVTHVGFQPTMIESLNKELQVRVLDLDPDNIGQVKRGVLVEGPGATEQALAWADLVMVTGTVLGNGTIDQFIDVTGAGLAGKPVVFYGTTIAGAADLMGWRRYCPLGA